MGNKNTSNVAAPVTGFSFGTGRGYTATDDLWQFNATEDLWQLTANSFTATDDLA